MNRPEIDLFTIEDTLEDFRENLMNRLRQKGFGTFASNHEIFGIIKQETTEYEETIHKRMSDEDKINELFDIAVACIFGAACIKSETLDW